MNKRQHQDDYYPLRWKAADGFEDMILLHRATVVGALALLGLGAIIAGFLIFNSGETTTTTATTSETTVPETVDEVVEDDDQDEAAPTTASAEATTTTPTTAAAPTTTEAPATTTTTTSTTTTTISPRAAASDEVVEQTENGRLLRITSSGVQLIGGLPTNTAADETLALATSTFPGLEIDDRQVVDDAFTDTQPPTVRFDAPDLFEYNSSVIDATYLPAIDQLAAAIIAEGWSVQVGGHTDASGSDDGNQRLSEERAGSATARLTAQGVDPAAIATVGFGETQPIASNGTEAGRLANRRVEFVLIATP